ncbi:MAG: hypothetical protein WCO84_04035 [bacterium]
MNDEVQIMKTIPKTTELSWETMEYEHRPVNKDWYWTVAFVSVFAAVISLYLGNFLFAIFAMIAGFTVIMHKVKGPDRILVRLTPRGIIVKNTLYPYGRIESFWIHDFGGDYLFNELSIRSDRAFLPQIIIPLGEADVELVRDYLAKFLVEEYHEKTISDVITDYLGF